MIIKDWNPLLRKLLLCFVSSRKRLGFLAAFSIFFSVAVTAQTVPTNVAISSPDLTTRKFSINWSNTGANYYAMQYAGDSAFEGFASPTWIDMPNVSTNSVVFDVANLVQYSWYKWRIKSCLANGTCSAWAESRIRSNPVASGSTPTLVSPSNNDTITFTSLNPCFSWNVDPGASSYFVVVSDTTEFPEKRWLLDVGTATSGCWNSSWVKQGKYQSELPSGLAYGVTYYWKVISTVNGVQGHSLTRTFTLRQKPLKPSNLDAKVVNNNWQVSWSISDPAVTKVKLQQVNNGVTTNYTISSGNTFSPSVTGSTTFRVMSCTVDDVCSTYTSDLVKNLTLAPVAPSNIAVSWPNVSNKIFGINWNDVGASSYQVQYGSAATTDQLPAASWYNLPSVSTPSTTVDMGTLGNNAWFKFHIRSCNADQICSAWVDSRYRAAPSVALSTYTTISPTNGALVSITNPNPCFSWNADPSATAYVLTVSDTPEFTEKRWAYNLPNLSTSACWNNAASWTKVGYYAAEITEAAPIPGKTYYWRVVSIVNGGYGYSETRTFQIKTTLDAPALRGGVVYNSRWQLDWAPPAGNVTGYQLYETRGGNTTVIPLGSNVLSYIPTVTGVVSYKIRACNSVCGDDSNTVPLNIDTAPSATNVKTTWDVFTQIFTSSWGGVSGAATYQLEYTGANTTNYDFIDGPWNALYSGPNLNYSVAVSALKPFSYYEWRVRACSASGLCSAWTQSRIRPVQAPPSSTSAALLAPANGVVTSINTPNPCFSWQADANATSYVVTVSDIDDFPLWRWSRSAGTNTRLCWDSKTNWDRVGVYPSELPQDLVVGKTYYWRVVSVGSTQQGYSQTRSFVATNLANAPEVTSKVENNSRWLLSWSAPDATVTRYEITQTNNGQVSRYTVTDPNFAPTAVGVTNFDVVACNQFGCTATPTRINVNLDAKPTVPQNFVMAIDIYNSAYQSSWATSAGAASYELQYTGANTVEEIGNNSWVVDFNENINGKTKSAILYSGYYFYQWRVRACAASGLCSDWAYSRIKPYLNKISSSSATLKTPVQDSVMKPYLNTACFEWDLDLLATTHFVVISDSPDFPDHRWQKEVGLDTKTCWANGVGWLRHGIYVQDLFQELEAGKTYYWKVVSNTASGQGHSAARKFVFGSRDLSLEAADLNAPVISAAYAATSGGFEINWSPVNGAVSHYVVTTNFTDDHWDNIVYENKFVPTVGYISARYTVKACNKTKCSPSSNLLLLEQETRQAENYGVQLSNATNSAAIGGYTGAGYVDLPAQVNAAATWRFFKSDAAQTQVTIRYFTPGMADGTFNLYVNNQFISTILVNGTNGAWSTAAFTLVASKGDNYIQLVNTGSTKVGIDNLLVKTTAANVASANINTAKNILISPVEEGTTQVALGQQLQLLSQVTDNDTKLWLNGDGKKPGVSYYINGKKATDLKLDVDSGIYFWTPSSAGTYTVKSVAYLDGGVNLESKIGTFVVTARQSPTATLTAPLNNAQISLGGSVFVTSSVSGGDNDVDSVELWVNGKATGLVNKKSPYSLSWSPSAAGDYQLKIIVRDKTQLQGESQIVTVKVLASSNSNNAPVTDSVITPKDPGASQGDGDIKPGFKVLELVGNPNNTYMYLNPPSASGVSYNSLTKLEIGKPLKIINTADSYGEAVTHAAKLIILDVDTAVLEQNIEIIGEPADLLIRTSGSGNSLSCHICSFSNFQRIMLAAASPVNTTNFTSGFLPLGELETISGGKISVNDLDAHGAASLELLAESLDLTGKINTQLLVVPSSQNNGLYEWLTSGSSSNAVVVGSGGVSLFAGKQKVRYDDLTVTKVVDIASETAKGVAKLDAGITSGAIKLMTSAYTNQITGELSTESSMVAGTIYNNQLSALDEGISITNLVETGMPFNVQGKLYSNAAVTVMAADKLTIAASATLKGYRVNVVGANAVRNDGQLIAQSDFQNLTSQTTVADSAKVNDAAWIKIDGNTFENTGSLNVKDKSAVGLIEIDTKGLLELHFGSSLLSNLVALKSSAGSVVNGSSARFRKLLDTDGLKNRSVKNSAQLATFTESWETGAKEASTSATIFAERITIDAADGVFNINPVAVYSENATPLSITDGGSMPGAGDVIISAEKSLAITAGTMVLNSSGVLSVNNYPGAASSNQDKLYVKSPKVINERYKVLAMAQYAKESYSAKNGDSTTTGTFEGLKTGLAAYSPPGVIYSFAPVIFDFGSSTQGGLLNNVSYIDVMNDAQFNGSGSVTTVGLALDKESYNSSEITRTRLKECFTIPSYGYYSQSGYSGSSNYGYATVCEITSNAKSETTPEGKVVETKLERTLYSIAGTTTAGSVGFEGYNHSVLADIKRNIIDAYKAERIAYWSAPVAGGYQDPNRANYSNSSEKDGWIYFDGKQFITIAQNGENTTHEAKEIAVLLKEKLEAFGNWLTSVLATFLAWFKG